MLLGLISPPLANTQHARLVRLTAPGDTAPSLAFFRDLVGGAPESYVALHGISDGAIVVYGRADRGDAAATCVLQLDAPAGFSDHAPHHDATAWGTMVIVGVTPAGDHRSLSEEEFAAFRLEPAARPGDLPTLLYQPDLPTNED